MKVLIYDQYATVNDENGKILHLSSGSTKVEAENLSDEQAKLKVSELYEHSKSLGSYADKLIKLENGYAELTIIFADKKKLNRVIYTEK